MLVESFDGIRDAASTLLEAGMSNIIVTLGARGVLWMTKEREVLLPATEVTPKDTTGAGDAFIGCFSHYLVEAGDVEAALAMANMYTARSVTKLGTQTSYATMEEFFKNHDTVTT